MNKKTLMLIISSSLLLILSFPPFDVYPLAWAALVPLLEAIENGPSFKVGWCCGLLFFGGLLYWIDYSLIVYGHLNLSLALSMLILLIIYLACYLGLFAFILDKANLFQSPLFPWLTGMLWVSLEYLRGHLLTGFPWELLGDSQYKWLGFIQMAELGGVYLLSFLIAVANACLYELITRYNKRAFINAGICGLLLLSGLFYGHLRLKTISKELRQSPKIKVGIIQGNIDESQKLSPAFQEAILHIYTNLTQKAAKGHPQLIIWPETAVTFFLQQPTQDQKTVLNLAKQIKTPILTGSPAYRITPEKIYYYNRAYLINKKGLIADYYDKVHLVPFAEYIPLRKFLSFIPAVAAIQGDFSPGRQIRPLLLNKQIPFGVLICFEGIFPEISRQLVLKGAQFLINITNDAWFGKTSAPYQHFSMLVLRAAEERRAIVRCANTGFSGIILPTGQIVFKSQLFKRQFLLGSVPLFKAKTPYATYGDILAYLCLCGILVKLVYLIFSNRRRLWSKKLKNT